MKLIRCFEQEVNNVNSPNDGNAPRHDILEVNGYFISGLAKSTIDAWFIGPSPHFQIADLNIPDFKDITLAQSITRAREAADDPAQTAWQMVSAFVSSSVFDLVGHSLGPNQTARANDLSHLDRNLEALIQELTQRCQRVFHEAAGAPSGSAVVSSNAELNAERITEEERPLEKSLAFPFRERTILNEVSALYTIQIITLKALGGRMAASLGCTFTCRRQHLE